MAPSTAAADSRTSNSKSPESYDSLHRRNAAAEILQSYEKLCWNAMARCESIAQTRLYFEGIVAGFSSADHEALIHWKEDLTPHPGSESRSSRKAKERLSSGGGGSAKDAREGSSKGKEKRAAEGSSATERVRRAGSKRGSGDDR